MRKRAAISLAAKLSAIDTTTNPANTMARYITTALTVIGMSIAMASPFVNVASKALATNLKLKFYIQVLLKDSLSSHFYRPYRLLIGFKLLPNYHFQKDNTFL